MPSQIFAFFLIALAAMPGFSGKLNLENKITKNLMGPNTAAANTFQPSSVVMPYKTDPLSQAASQARSAYFIDFNSGEVLFSRNENSKLSMASTTKLMTALVASENLEQSKVVTIWQLNTLPLDSVMGLTTGDKIKVSELMYGLLIPSGADAASALAIAASGSEAKFVTLMNEKASQFGLTDTQFSNPIGHDNPNNFSTAKDLAGLARIALSNKQVANIVSKQNYVAHSMDGKGYYLLNTNQLLSDPNYKGVKTGTTGEAGQCLIVLYNDGNRKILGVVLDSPDRFGETQGVIEWTKQVFSW